MLRKNPNAWPPSGGLDFDDFRALALQIPRRLFDRPDDGRRRLEKTIVNEHADFQILHRSPVLSCPVERRYGVEELLAIRLRQYSHRQPQVFDSARQGSRLRDNRLLTQGEKVFDRGIILRQAARRGFKSVDAAKMRRYANAAAKIAGQSKGAAADRKNGRFAATAATGRTGEIPGIVGAAVKRIVAFKPPTAVA